MTTEKLAYQAFEETFGGQRFAALKTKGARVQRPLWASTGTKNAAYSDVLYVDSLMGPHTVNTMPDATLEAFLDHGQVAQAITQGVTEAEDTVDSLASSGISLSSVTDQLLVDGVKAFADSFDQLMVNIEEKRSRLLTKEESPR